MNVAYYSYVGLRCLGVRAFGLEGSDLRLLEL